ncbi:MAG: acryloyl-CoA reductase [Ilumatobacteraceae bacterium]|jgi:acrylyl-CoA reductase (NADPH)|nr:acryloyl-CoA reductase [Ilumatobacteraceae bacterium]
MSIGRFPAFMFTNDPEAPRREVVEIGLEDLSGDGVLIEVEWSSVNYKDGLATSPKGKVARISPLIPGVDLAGTVVDSGGSRFAVGQKVIAHAYDIGVAHHGGYARYARIPADWVLELPEGLSTRDAMVIGTGGFTSAESVMALLDRGLAPSDGPVLVTGATGGVGSMAITMLAALGFEVVASSGKKEAEDYLRSLGAARVIDRAELSVEDPKPLGTMTFAGAVDCVGGVTLANVVKRLNYGAAVAASGLTGGAGLATTVMPFILRGVALLGIDSVQLPMAQRVEVWKRLASDLKPAGIDRIGHEIGLNQLDAVLTAILKGEVTGRYVVRPTVD